MRTKYKQWAVDYLDEHPEHVINNINEMDEFLSSKKIAFEIGSGKGDFILQMAKNNPDVNYLAIERVKTVAGMMLKKLVEEEINNVKVFPNDANILFDELKDNSIDTIYLNFVDPWPKKRHEKRRLTYLKCLNQYYRILKKDGLIAFKSDNDGLFEYSVEQFEQTLFKAIEIEEDYVFDEKDDAMSEYETKFRNLGQKIHRIVMRK